MNSVTWFGSVFFVSMATCATLAHAGASMVQGEPSGATPVLLAGDREVRTSVTLEGFVLAPDGSPAEGALVTSSAGGSVLTDAAGSYRLEVELPLEATSVQVTAVGSAGAHMVASTSVALSVSASPTRVPPLAFTYNPACLPGWVPTFGGSPGTYGPVEAVAVYDDGHGPALYVAGDFTRAGSVAANRIARWDGRKWTALGSGLDGRVLALAVFDDGHGAALYAGGQFRTAGGAPASRIARWDGARWTEVGGGTNTSVLALAVHDDGSGPALFAGGDFTTAGGAPATGIARWDGARWSDVGGGMDHSVYVYVKALAVYDDGSGPALYAGGDFTTAGGAAASRIARWDGASWTALGNGIDSTVEALAVFDDGHGPALYAGGFFRTAGGVDVSHVARWDGSSWSALGGPGDSEDLVLALAVHDDGRGAALYVGGDFRAQGNVTPNIARWDGASWTAVGSGMDDSVTALLSYDDGRGTALYAGGFFANAGGAGTWGIAKWDGSSWSALGGGDVYGSPDALATYDDGGGRALYAGGYSFAVASAAGPVEHLAKWDGSSWSALGSGVDGGVNALAVYDDGRGPALYAGGYYFALAGSVVAHGIARWSGASWEPLGSGVDGGVGALAVYDAGTGPERYVAGQFSMAGGGSAHGIARWDGAFWSRLGDGVSGSVNALALYDDGSGPALYAAGQFSTAGSVAASCIARWDGGRWSALGSGLNGRVESLAVYDDGGGRALYAAGQFSKAGGVTADNIARWDGVRWSRLSPSFVAAPHSIHALAVHDNGSGKALYAGGYFHSMGGVAARNIARWDGSSWSALGSGTGMDQFVSALVVHDDGGGPALYAGGSILVSDSGDVCLAKWGCD
jgi:hypothetical protein